MTKLLASTERCEPCGFYTCIHKMENRTQVIDIGEQVGSPIENVAEPRYRISSELDPNRSASSIGDGTYTICQYCDKAVVNQNFCTKCGKSLRPLDNTRAVLPVKTDTTEVSRALKDVPIATTNTTVSTQTVVDAPLSKSETTDAPTKADALTKCTFCDKDIFVKWLDAHLKTHITEVAEKPEITAYSAPPLLLPASSNPKIDLAKYTPISTEKKEVAPQVKALETFKYREIENLSVESFVSNDGRFSDFNITVWLKDRFGVSDTSYAGGIHYASRDQERAIIGITLDTIDEYYSVSIKLLKQSSYSSWDTEESAPEKLCFDQTEIYREVKRALLFFRISPKAVYKRFMKLIAKLDFTIQYDDEGKAISCSTSNTQDLIAHLKDKKTISKADDDDDEWRRIAGGMYS